MNKQFSLLITTFIVLTSLCVRTENKTPISWDQSRYFDTAFLANFNAVRSALLEDGFKNVTIPTRDGLNLNGLLLVRENAQYTVISCCGFYPGRKEGMASLVPLLPDNCNILFFDARGHGKSEGRFLTALYRYGNDEYQDVIGAIDFACLLQKPIMIHSICAGAFHASRALITLHNQDSLKKCNVLGLVFDSGFGSVLQAIHIPQKHTQNKIVPSMITRIYKQDTKKNVQERWAYKIASTVLSKCVGGIEFCMEPFITQNDPETNVMDKIHVLNCPLFFIHARNDSYTPFAHTEQLATKVTYKTCWWLQESEHACNHLKYKHEYKQRLQEFLDAALLKHQDETRPT